MVEYKTFDHWFDETENYGSRFERFYEELHNAKNSVHLAELTTIWLRAAFESARLTKENKLSGYSSKKQMANDRWIVDIQEDPETGDCILQFPPSLIEQTGWKEGDELLWEKAAGQSWTLRKKP
jgi:hypothetical protein